MKVALAQIDTAQGDLVSNFERQRTFVVRAVEQGAEVVLFPELSVAGYCPRDLLARRAFVEAVRRHEERLAAAIPAGIVAIVGSVRPSPEREGRLYNVACVLGDGGVRAVVAKQLLPNYDVFDERRYFDPGPSSSPIHVAGRQVGVTVCEDAWYGEEHGREMPRYDRDPAADLARAGAEIIFNLAASPYHLGKREERRGVLRRLARRIGCPVMQCNLVGGNDDVLFDGHSTAVDGDGEVIAEAKGFEEDLVIVDLGDAASAPDLELTPCSSMEELRRALVMGVRDYARKSGFDRALLGLSGGIDSALTAALAVEALGPEAVTGIAMPSRHNAAASLDDARELARRLGMNFKVAPIERMFSIAVDELTPHFEGRAPDVTEENMQARLRGLILMAFANKFGALLLTTGNKSELAVGYCTLYGDMCGGLAVISDVPKTMVYELSEYLNRRGDVEIIPRRIIDRPPSAELRPDQLDSDSLPSYDVLDDILVRAVERGEDVRSIIESGHDERVVREVLDRVWRNEYKRKQMPPGLRVTTKAFGVGRRMPLTGSPVWFDNQNDRGGVK